MNTTKLYQIDTYLQNWTAEITSANKYEDKDDLWEIMLNQTAFFPEGGGQSCDLGYIGAYEVIDVQESGEQVIHTIKVPEGVQAPSTGMQAECSLDWPRRFDNMQRHCGEHILSGIFFDLFGGVNRGFHMGQDYMTIDISLEAKPEITQITYEMALEAELGANKVIWSNAPVTVLRFDSREEAEKMPLRKALAFDEDISIVCVGSVENAADCVACCGTHPSTAGQVGVLKIYKVENYKGMFRIYFEAGQRALNDYRAKHNILTDLSNKYSSSIEDFPAKLKSQEDKLAEAKNELFHIKKAFTDNECAKLDEILSQTSEKVVTYNVPQLPLDDTFNMAKRYMSNCNKLIMLYSEKDTSYILVSDGSIDCGKLVKEYASFYKGKGGGNKVSARGIFTSQEDAEMFADLVKKHLK
jgi:alanyl-tRNA synthetase